MKLKKTFLLDTLFYLYQKIISPILHLITKFLFGDNNRCRFTPTCSEYAKQSFKKHHFFKALYLSLTRLLRCNPLFPGGYDPVPDDKI